MKSYAIVFWGFSFLVLTGTVFCMMGFEEAQKMETAEFVILIASWNNERYVEENLKSACFQKSSRPYHILYVNDCSTDRTGEIAERFVRENNLQSLVTIIHNEKNLGQAANYYNAIHLYVPDGKIVVTLDGDDTFSHNEVLLVLEGIYADKDVWMTYGNCVEYPSMRPVMYHCQIPDKVIKRKSFRKKSTAGHHLRTWRSELFKKIRKESLMHEGSFFKITGDHAVMFPMLEMCSPYKRNGVNHSRFISEVLYYWRTDNPLNDFRSKGSSQIENAKIIASLPPYDALETLE